MEKFNLSSEQYDYEIKDSLLQFDIKTQTRFITCGVQPFHSFIVMEQTGQETGFASYGYFKFYTDNNEEWNEYYEKIVKLAGKGQILRVKELQKRRQANLAHVRKFRN